MDDPNLSTLLHDAAEAAPDPDLTPAALRAAKRLRIAQTVGASAIFVPTVALVVGLAVMNRPSIALTQLPAGQPLSTAAPSGSSQQTPPPPPSPGPSTSTPATVTPTLGPSSTPTDGLPTPTSVNPTIAPTTSAVVPDRVGFKASDLPHSMVLLQDFGQYANQPSALGQYCDIADNGASGTEPRPIGGRQWMFAQHASNADQYSADEVVTIWADGAKALADLQHDTGYCRFRALNWPGFTTTKSTSTDFAAHFNSASAGPIAVHSVLVGKALVSVTLYSPRGASLAQLTADADRLAHLAASRLKG